MWNRTAACISCIIPICIWIPTPISISTACQKTGTALKSPRRCCAICWDLRPCGGSWLMSGIREVRRRQSAALHLAAKLGSQAILVGTSIALLGWVQGPLFYFVFWVIPLFSVFPAIIRLRIVTEHFSPDHYSEGEKPFVSRSTSTNRIEDYLFGCDMQFHFEHHLLPMIPHAQLARLHQALVDKDFFQTLPPENDYLSSGYLRFWWRLVTGQLTQSASPPLAVCER